MVQPALMMDKSNLTIGYMEIIGKLLTIARE
jgi:hypothetical protein